MSGGIVGGSMRVDEWKWPDVQAYLAGGGDMAVGSIGALEQHGRHLPMGTDTFTAYQVALDAGSRTGVPVYPPIAFGWSTHHLAYPGTVSLRPETVIAVVEDFCHSLIYHGFKKILIVNGHRRANLAPLDIALSRVRHRTGAWAAVVDLAYIATEEAARIRTSAPGGIGHADEMETSHMLHLRPDLVDMSRAGKNLPPRARFLPRVMQQDWLIKGDAYNRPNTIGEFEQNTAPDGLVGDASAGSAEKGARYHRALVECLVDLIETVKPLHVELEDRRPLF